MKPPGTIWTDAQFAAINAVGRDVLVSAGAGTGKTAVLVERYITLLTRGVPPEELLAITFTRKAASQLRARVMKALSKSNLKELVELVPRVADAEISTIDSFCLSLIREFAAELRISPASDILEDEAGGRLRAMALDQVIREQASDAAKSSRYRKLVALLSSGKGDLLLRNTVLLLHEFLVKLASPDQRISEWLNLYADAANAPSFFETVLGEHYLVAIQTEIASLKRSVRAAARDYSRLAPPGEWGKVFPVEFELAEKVIAAFPNIERMSAMLGKYTRYKPIPKAEDDAASAWRDRWDALFKSRIMGFRAEWLVAPGDLAFDLGWLVNDGLLDAFFGLVTEFGETYAKMKRIAGAFDYTDIERHAYRLLTEIADAHPNVNDALRARFSNILMDETQDTNPLQDAIFGKLAEGGAGSIFRVGDVKQSIYRFRHAEPDLFVRKFDGIRRGEVPGGELHLLSENFRSVVPVIDFVNAVFSRLMVSDFGGVDYADGHELVYKLGEKAQPPTPPDALPPISIALIARDRRQARAHQDEDAPDNEEQADVSDMEMQELEAKEIEAHLAARTILDLMSAEPPAMVLDDAGGDLAPVRLSYKHIAILLSSPASWLDAYENVFAAHGIPVWFAGKASSVLDKEPLVRDLISLLETVDNPIQDIPLAASLLGPACGMLPDFLYIARKAAEGDSPLYDAVCAATTDDGFTAIIAMLETDLPEESREVDWIRNLSREREKLVGFLAWIDGTRRLAQMVEVHELVSLVISDAKLEELALLSDHSDDVLDRIEWVRSYSCACPPGGLAEFVDRLKDVNPVALPAAKVGNRVLVSSIHQAKGLEFPVVILAGLGHGFNLRDLTDAVLFDRELGLGTKVLHPQHPTRYPTAAYRVIEGRSRTKQLEEEARKLYVAMTRARERLHIIGTVERNNLVTNYPAMRGQPGTPVVEPERAGCFADWIVPMLYESQSFQSALTIAGIAAPGHPAGFPVALKSDILDRREIIRWAKERAIESAPSARVDMLEASHGDGEARDSQDGLGDLDSCIQVVGFKYPFGAAPLIPAKLSASRIADMDDPEGRSTSPVSDPAFDFAPAGNGARGPDIRREAARLRGIAAHVFMQNLPFGQGRSIDLLAETERMKADGVMAQADLETLPLDGIARFLTTPLGHRLQGRGNARSEWAFMARLLVREMTGDQRAVRAVLHGLTDALGAYSGDDYVILQGTVDLIFEDESGRYIIDWKTDDVPAEGAAARADRYFLQMWAYKYAVDRTFGETSAATVAFLKPGVSVEISV